MPYSRDTVEVQLSWSDNSNGDFRNGGDYCVMIFHTHPPLWYCPIEKRNRILGPSKLDVDKHTKIPAIVYDFDNTNFTKITPPNSTKFMYEKRVYLWSGKKNKLNFKQL